MLAHLRTHNPIFRRGGGGKFIKREHNYPGCNCKIIIDSKDIPKLINCERHKYLTQFYSQGINLLTILCNCYNICSDRHTDKWIIDDDGLIANVQIINRKYFIIEFEDSKASSFVRYDPPRKTFGDFVRYIGRYTVAIASASIAAVNKPENIDDIAVVINAYIEAMRMLRDNPDYSEYAKYIHDLYEIYSWKSKEYRDKYSLLLLNELTINNYNIATGNCVCDY